MEDLAGTYADPFGGQVRLSVDGQTFTLQHSLLGPVQGSGNIDRHHLAFRSHFGTFDGQQIVWDNGVCAMKLGPLPSLPVPIIPQASSTPTQGSNRLSTDSVINFSSFCIDDVAALVRRPLWTAATVPFDCDRSLPEMRALVALLHEHFGIPHLRARSKVELRAKVVPALKREGLLVDAPSAGPNMYLHIVRWLLWAQTDLEDLGSIRMADCGVTKTLAEQILAGMRNIRHFLNFDDRAWLNVIDDFGNIPRSDLIDLAFVVPKWSMFEKGRSLFINGLGTFDIGAAQRHVSRAIVSDCSTPAHLLPCPVKLQAVWYVLKLLPSDTGIMMYDEREYDTYVEDDAVEALFGLFKLQRTDFRFRYFVRHHKVFNNDLLRARLDELLELPAAEGDLPLGCGLNTPPLRLLDAMLEHRWQNKIAFVHFAWLDNLPDIETSLGVLCPVRDSYALVHISKEMRNCADIYVEDVRERQCLLMSLVKPGTKPVALGEFRGRGWKQLVGFANAPVPEDVENIYNASLPTLQSWWQKHSR